jgi:membrane-bound lytic murein transglycosylase B
LKNNRALYPALIMALAMGFTIDARAAGGKPAASYIQRAPVVQAETYAGRPEVAEFAEEMAERGVDPAWIAQVLSAARKLESVRRAVKPAAAGQRKNWQAYRDRFVEPARTQAGREFMQRHAEALERASQQYGVPTDVILGILGVETFYGRDTGRYRVIDSLATLAFDYPAEDGKDRSGYFREQLAHFFLWCSKEQCNPLTIKGSYAGAMGIPQFMPQNILLYGADFDGDGRINLHHPVDAIGSVARYLALHGWVRQLAPTAPIELFNARLEALLAPDIIPTFMPLQLLIHGAKPLVPMPIWEKYAVVELQNGDAESEYVLGSRNFYVLTRYNRSSFYAMAVLALGQEVVAAPAAGGESAAITKTDLVSGRVTGDCPQC